VYRVCGRRKGGTGLLDDDAPVLAAQSRSADEWHEWVGVGSKRVRSVVGGGSVGCNCVVLLVSVMVLVFVSGATTCIQRLRCSWRDFAGGASSGK